MGYFGFINLAICNHYLVKHFSFEKVYKILFFYYIMKILLGPAGSSGLGNIDGVKQVENLGLQAMEVEFTYGVNLSNDKAKLVGDLAKKLNINLSIHAPYYINLNSHEKKKIEDSKRRIMDSAERGHYLGATHIVFHPGFYGKKSPDETFTIVVEEVKELIKKIKENKWKVKLAPETMGKVNVFGSLDETLGLVKKTKCSFTIDFAHILARSKGKIDYDDVFNKLKGHDHLHCHFSGIEWGEKGEKNHKITPDKEIKELVSEILKMKKSVTIINESPNPMDDALRTKKEFIKQGYTF